MSVDACLAAMMPATRAACSGSPFFTAPARTRRSASRDIAIDPRATASRSVTGLPPTSTILIRPRGSMCERRAAIILLSLAGPHPRSPCPRTLRAAALACWAGRRRRPPGRPGPPGRRAPPGLPGLFGIALTLGQKEREALERHREIDALQFHVLGHLQRPRRE